MDLIRQLCVILILSGIAVLCVYFYSIHANYSESSQSTAPTSTDACVASEGLVEKLLKAPATEKFPDCFDQKIANIGENKWQVSSYVDAQNSFGALLRTYYTVVVEDKKDANDTWELVDSKFSEQ